MVRKADIEAELDAHYATLKAQSVTMRTPLVDTEGFPRADLDIFAIRGARVRIIELRNDLDALMNEIGKALEGVYDPAVAPQQDSSFSSENAEELSPFARVNGVAPGSPAAEAGLQREDVIVKFGPLTKRSFGSESLQPLASLVSQNENRQIVVEVLRRGQSVRLNLLPRKGWGGRGMLGCHIVPHASS
ncbi:hypothetical protein FISHEDRAFT_66898 [Fistulina hepatica ATCC 64428]|uniref:Probable 26S proteasome regulatory subunit p27 n=1 Tax=Fistulina hepatica ATCC 64428 TaxID=1128425 RepID=A0A0D7A5H6_9AGAR|nr:hypothetical protein FISHEDRAFT_66898 [Fistulina hepatica ATCC 64428]